MSGPPRLRVLWCAEPPSSPVEDPRLDVRVVERPNADAHRDWAEVLVDGRASALLAGAALRHVVVPFAGLGADLRAALIERPHLRVSNSHANAPFVAQHMVAMLLTLAGSLLPHDVALRGGDWGEATRRVAPPSRWLAGRRALLLGYGAIGRAAVPMLRGFGLEVRALRRRPQLGADPPELPLATLHEALAQADVVLCSLPATPATVGLLDRAALARLTPHALLVNVGRGAVIDEDALYDALAQGRLGGAALDVWWRYPSRDERASTLPAQRPFWTLPNVLLSPHRADDADALAATRDADVVATLRSIADGAPRSLVDVDAGY